MASGYSVTAKFCVLNMSLQEKSGTIESKTDFIDRFSIACFSKKKGEFLKGRVRRTLLFFFLVMYSAIPLFF